jgi:hypothetical protein
MTCEHILDWPVGSGEPLLLDGHEWCMAWIDLGWTCQRHLCRPENCPYDLGEVGAWRSIAPQVAAILASDAYAGIGDLIDRVERLRAQAVAADPGDTTLTMAVACLEWHRTSEFHDRAGDLLRAAGWARSRGSGPAGGADYLGGRHA